MRVYNEVIAKLAKQAFSNYMGGSMNSPLYGLDTATVAFIYGKDVTVVDFDVEVAFDHLCMDHRNSLRKAAI